MKLNYQPEGPEIHFTGASFSFPESAPQPANTTVNHPPGDLSFMLGIPAIGTKFKDAEELGPQSGKYHYQKRRVKDGALQIELTFDFR